MLTKRNENRIALMVPTLEGGGAERTFITLAQGLSEAGFQVDLIVKKKIGEYSSQIPTGVNVIDLDARKWRLTLLGVSRYLRAAHPRALISALDFPNMVSVLSAMGPGIQTKTVITIHSIISQYDRLFMSYRPLERIILSFLYSRADQIIAVSKAVAQDLSQYLHIPLNKARVIYNPIVYPGMLKKSREEIDHPWFLPGEPPVLISVGRLNPVKDYPTLLRAFQIVRRERPSRLMILGEGEQRQELESLVHQLDLDDDVLLPGFQQNPYPYLRKADIFVQSSLHEALSTVIVEAMACECPVVATDCPGGTAELTDFGKYGHLVPVGDDHRLAEAILLALSGDTRKPPPVWLDQFKLDVVIQEYLEMI